MRTRELVVELETGTTETQETTSFVENVEPRLLSTDDYNSITLGKFETLFILLPLLSLFLSLSCYAIIA